MLVSLLKRLLVCSIACVICLSCMGFVSSFAISDDGEVPAYESAVTSCWTGFCGHKNETYTWPSYAVSSKPTAYKSLGLYVDKGGSISVSCTTTTTGGLTATGTFGSDKAKLAIGVSGSFAKANSVSLGQTNSTSARLYAHAGAQYETRGNTLTLKKRTYNPAWDILWWNNCKRAV